MRKICRNLTKTFFFCLPSFIIQAQEIILTLQRGWNSRLGFSVRSSAECEGSFVSAIYADSVAYKDGRLKVGDRLLRVNTTDVGAMPTSEVISILRTLRGTILLTLSRN
jgi:C-terminal processing protease CtpA/Prc